jgi:hypothetical protein
MRRKLTVDQRTEFLDTIRALELDLVRFHNECVAANVIPRGLGREWEQGVHLLQMCLMSRRLVIIEADTETNFHPFYRNDSDYADKNMEKSPLSG